MATTERNTNMTNRPNHYVNVTRVTDYGVELSLTCAPNLKLQAHPACHNEYDEFGKVVKQTNTCWSKCWTEALEIEEMLDGTLEGDGPWRVAIEFDEGLGSMRIRYAGRITVSQMLDELAKHEIIPDSDPTINNRQEAMSLRKSYSDMLRNLGWLREDIANRVPLQKDICKEFGLPT